MTRHSRFGGTKVLSITAAGVNDIAVALKPTCKILNLKRVKLRKLRSWRPVLNFKSPYQVKTFLWHHYPHGPDAFMSVFALHFHVFMHWFHITQFHVFMDPETLVDEKFKSHYLFEYVISVISSLFPPFWLKNRSRKDFLVIGSINHFLHVGILNLPLLLCICLKALAAHRKVQGLRSVSHSLQRKSCSVLVWC